MTFTFKKAVRSESKLRLALEGISGSGKTYSALRLAKGLGGKIAVVDTERGSASLYSGLPGIPEFDVLELTDSFSPEVYVDAIHAAEEAGYNVIILDSITPEWSGKNGCLELADLYSKGNSLAGWKKVTPLHRKFLDTIVNSKCHIIATMRSKAAVSMVDGKVKKVQDKTEQRDGTEFEFTVVLSIDRDSHNAVASKDRTGLFKDPEVLTEETGKKLLSWLSGAATISPEIQAEAEKAAQLGVESIKNFMASLKEKDPEQHALFSDAEKKRLYVVARKADINATQKGN